MGAAIVFPGQGSQYVGMADVWRTHDLAREVLDDATAVIGHDVVEGCHDERALSRTEFVQPALLACDLAAHRVLEAAGSVFFAAAGHSLGEFAALVAAGVLRLEDALQIVVIRGRAMQASGEARPGTMTALVGVGASEAQQLCDMARGIDVLLVANDNAPRQVVISGSIDAIERAEELASGQRIRAIRLNVAGAFHSPLMEDAVGPLSRAIDEAEFGPPRIPVASNVTGALVSDPEELRSLAKLHVVSPVRWNACLHALQVAGGDTFVEAGPQEVLTKLARRAVPGVRAIAVDSPEAAVALAPELA